MAVTTRAINKAIKMDTMTISTMIKEPVVSNNRIKDKDGVEIKSPKKIRKPLVTSP